MNKTPKTTTKATDLKPDQTGEVERAEARIGAEAAKPAEERTAETDSSAPDPAAPYPSQADLDAIKEGRFSDREVTAGAAATYRTR